MKIEKVNDNQICCTLTREDLESRQLHVKDLAYGSKATRQLFADMIEQAGDQFGFDAEDFPIMVEAIPMSEESIVLLITKVEYPDELDARFSEFSVSDEDEDDVEVPVVPERIPGADDVLGHFRGDDRAQRENGQTEQAGAGEPQKDLVRTFVFSDMRQVERYAAIVRRTYHGRSSLYRSADGYLLQLHKDDHSPAEFNRVCNIATEYAHAHKYSSAAGAYCREHGHVIVSNRAVQMVGQLLEGKRAVP